MTRAQDIMHKGAECVSEQVTLREAARRMADRDIGSLVICNEDEHVRGIVTDRDIVVKCIARGYDPAMMTAGEIAQGEPVTIDAGADAAEVLRTMETHLVRRLPVVEAGRPVGVISEADLARHLTPQQVGHFVETIAAAG